MQIFFFSEFCIGSFFAITLPRFHFNIYAWLHLKHLCVDIYASLVYPTSHLCVVLQIRLKLQNGETRFICSGNLYTLAETSKYK